MLHTRTAAMQIPAALGSPRNVCSGFWLRSASMVYVLLVMLLASHKNSETMVDTSDGACAKSAFVYGSYQSTATHDRSNVKLEGQ